LNKKDLLKQFGPEMLQDTELKGFESDDDTKNIDPLAQILRKFKVDNQIIYQDEDIFVFNKPPFITSETDNSDQKSFADLIKEKYPEAMLCHRLDKETSGAIIAARNKEAYRYISMAFDTKDIGKIYHAIVKGHIEIEERALNYPLSKQGSFKAVVDKAKGKDALTLVKTHQLYKHFTVLACQPITGRFHQIRIHLASSGIPIIGDSIYGGAPFFLSEVKRKFNTGKYQEEKTFLQRTALHSRVLEFKAPSGKQLRIEAPYPKDFGTIVDLLNKYDSPK